MNRQWSTYGTRCELPLPGNACAALLFLKTYHCCSSRPYCYCCFRYVNCSLTVSQLYCDAENSVRFNAECHWEAGSYDDKSTNALSTPWQGQQATACSFSPTLQLRRGRHMYDSYHERYQRMHHSQQLSNALENPGPSTRLHRAHWCLKDDQRA